MPFIGRRSSTMAELGFPGGGIGFPEFNPATAPNPWFDPRTSVQLGQPLRSLPPGALAPVPTQTLERALSPAGRIEGTVRQVDAADGKRDGWVTQAELRRSATDEKGVLAPHQKTVLILLADLQRMGLQDVPLPSSLVEQTLKQPKLFDPLGITTSMVLAAPTAADKKALEDLSTRIDSSKDNNVSVEELTEFLATDTKVTVADRRTLTELRDSLSASGGNVMMTTAGVADKVRSGRPPNPDVLLPLLERKP
jgi:hypothetical protein